MPRVVSDAYSSNTNPTQKRKLYKSNDWASETEAVFVYFILLTYLLTYGDLSVGAESKEEACQRVRHRRW